MFEAYFIMKPNNINFEFFTDYKYLGQDKELVKNIASILLWCIDNNRKVNLDSLPNSGKTTVIKTLARLVYMKRKGMRTALSVPNRAINRNKKETVNRFEGKHDAENILQSQDGASLLQGVWDTSASRIVALNLTDEVLFAADESENLYNHIGFRPTAIRNIFKMDNILGMSGTAIGLEWSPDWINIKIRPRITPKPKRLLVHNHDKYPTLSLVKGIIDYRRRDLANKELLVLRINSYLSIARAASYIKANYPELTYASLYSVDGRQIVDTGEGDYRGARNDNRNKYDNHSKHLSNDIIDDLRGLKIANGIDILLTTQIADEGLDIDLQGLNKLGNKRHLFTHILCPKVPTENEEGVVVGQNIKNITPENIAQISARERSGNQTTTIHTKFGDKKLSELNEKRKIKVTGECIEDMTSLYNETKKRAKLRFEDFQSELLGRYNIECVEIDNMVKRNIYSKKKYNNAELRAHYANVGRYEEYLRIMTEYGNENYIPQQMEANIKNVEPEVLEMISSEIAACRLGIDFELFINEDLFNYKRLRALIQSFDYLESNHDNKAVNELAELVLAKKDIILDLSVFRKGFSKIEQDVIKTLANTYYDSNRCWNRKSINLTYDFEATYPEYYHINIEIKQMLERQNTKQEEIMSYDDEYTIIERPNSWNERAKESKREYLLSLDLKPQDLECVEFKQIAETTLDAIYSTYKGHELKEDRFIVQPV